MGKKLLVLLVATVMILGVFTLSGCAPIEIVYVPYRGDYGDYTPIDLVMNAGDTYTIEASHFRALDIEFDKFELVIPRVVNSEGLIPDAGIVALDGNVITAQSNGFQDVGAYLYQRKIPGEKFGYARYILVGQIQVINIAEMTEITTAQELQDMSLDVAGHYILKADIDLAGFDWKPIMGNYYTDDGFFNLYMSSFRGSLINPDGFVIKNLTSAGGLFAETDGAYVDGIILENVKIDSTGLFHEDSDIEYATVSGGIASYATDTIIANCKVEGEIIARNNAGGIAGSVRDGVIRNCEFSGIAIAQYEIGQSYWAEAGGIAGRTYIYLPYDVLRFSCKHLTVGIFDCKVNAQIISIDYAGGIVGFNQGQSIPKDWIFNGSVQGNKGQGEMFGQCSFCWFTTPEHGSEHNSYDDYIKLKKRN